MLYHGQYHYGDLTHTYVRILSTGCGDFMLCDVSVLADPCPLPDSIKKRSLNEREKQVYAPMSGVGGVVYDKVRYLYSTLQHTLTVYNHMLLNPGSQYDATLE